jgi:CubicO group peptidase (beta-lactamase class C family)
MSTRRDFLRRGTAVLGAVAFPKLSGSTVQGVPKAEVFAWHDKTLEEHHHLRDTYYKLGYRFRSLSIYGDGHPKSTYFAAVMIKRPEVVAQRDFSLVPAKEFQGIFDAQARENYGPVILSACGPTANPTFSAVFEPQNPIPLVRVGLGSGDASNPNTLQGAIAAARKQGLRMRWAASYGDAKNPSFAGIWGPNPDNSSWNCDGILDSDAECQQRFDAEVSAWCRPSLVTLNAEGRYLQLFENTNIGPWYALRGLGAAEYQAAYQEATGKGYFPLTVQAAGAVRQSARFAVVFAQSEDPVARKWSATGPVTNDAIDAVVRHAMAKTPVRQAALAIVRGSRLVYARGYTLAEPGWPVVEPTTYFRLASVSKTVASLALFQLLESGDLRLSDRLQDILQLETPAGGKPADPRFRTITLAELFEHTSNLDPDGYRDAGAIVQAFHIAKKPASLPVNAAMTDAYIASLRLEPPPQAMVYNNCGYHLLGRVLAKKRNTHRAMEAIRKDLLGPLSITRLRQSVSLISGQHPDEGRQQDPELGLAPSVMTKEQPLVPKDYGDWNMEVDEAAGGFSGAVTDVARLVAILIDPKDNPALKRSTLRGMLEKAVANQMKWNGRTQDLRAGYGLDAARHLGGERFYGQKGGSGAGWGDWIQFSGEWGLVVCLGGNGGPGWGHDAYPDFPGVMNLAEKVNWGPEDLFPQFGMPSL